MVKMQEKAQSLSNNNEHTNNQDENINHYSVHKSDVLRNIS